MSESGSSKNDITNENSNSSSMRSNNQRTNYDKYEDFSPPEQNV